MNLSDNLKRIRKENNLSQEQLADKLGVSRQSVSKWEGAQSVPDLDKIVRLSKLFGVSTDYLLKDEIEDADVIVSEENDSNRRVTLEEANHFIEVKIETSKMIANGVFLCIISPICLLMLGALSETGSFGISENVAGAVGLIVLIILVAIAVAIFIYSHSKTARYEYLEEEIFDTEYGVISMVKERKEKFQSTYTKNNIIGVSLCILAMVPFFAGAMFEENNLILMVSLFCLALFIVGIGVILFVRVGIIWESFAKLLQEGDYTKEKKEKSSPVIIRREVILSDDEEEKKEEKKDNRRKDVGFVERKNKDFNIVYRNKPSKPMTFDELFGKKKEDKNPITDE